MDFSRHVIFCRIWLTDMQQVAPMEFLDYISTGPWNLSQLAALISHIIEFNRWDSPANFLLLTVRNVHCWTDLPQTINFYDHVPTRRHQITWMWDLSYRCKYIVLLPTSTIHLITHEINQLQFHQCFISPCNRWGDHWGDSDVKITSFTCQSNTFALFEPF